MNDGTAGRARSSLGARIVGASWGGTAVFAVVALAGVASERAEGLALGHIGGLSLPCADVTPYVTLKRQRPALGEAFVGKCLDYLVEPRGVEPLTS